MGEILFVTILVIFVINFLIEKYVAYLNTTKMSSELPDYLIDLYDKDEYSKQQNYQKDNNKLELLSSSLMFVIVLFAIISSTFGHLDSILRYYISHPILLSLSFFGILYFVTEFLQTPFTVYDIFVIEEKYGFNKMSANLFFLDKLKGILLSTIIGGGLISLIIFIFMKIPDLFWVVAWLVVSAISLFFAMFYSSIIVPLFNKQTPLPEGELRTAIEKFSTKVGFQLNNIYLIDGSKRSTKANAYFTGLGPKKRIVLYDTLVNELTTNEIVAVLAHEIGHYKHKHVWKGIVSGLIQAGIMFFVFGLLINNVSLSEALGGKQVSFHLGMISFGILYSPLSAIMELIVKSISRKHEFEADKFAKDYANSNDLASALIKLSIKSLSNLTPHPVYVWFHYSHPPLLKRLAALKNKA